MLKQARNAGGKVRGVLWYQGESDANPDAAELFLDRFKGLVAAFREDLKSPQLPFLYVQIGRHVTNASVESNASWDRIQELQRIAERVIPGSAVISVMDLPLDDPIHVGVDGQKRAGKRLAKIAHRVVFGADGVERGPRLVSADVDTSGRVVRVTYNEVNGRLLPDKRVEGFAVVGPDGKKIPTIYKAYVDPKSTNVVILELSRPLRADAKLHYALGRESVCNLVDEEDMAAHAFGPVEIGR
jgi:sialate O-acetylesterase